MRERADAGSHGDVALIQRCSARPGVRAGSSCLCPRDPVPPGGCAPSEIIAVSPEYGAELPSQILVLALSIFCGTHGFSGS